MKVAGGFKIVSAGAFIGRCYELIDLGTQTSETGQYAGKSAHKIKIGFELFGEDEDGTLLTVDVDGKQMPMTITKDYTVSLEAITDRPVRMSLLRKKCARIFLLLQGKSCIRINRK